MPQSTACIRKLAASMPTTLGIRCKPTVAVRAGATADVAAAQAKGLNDQQIADLAACFASVPRQLRDLQDIN